METTETTKGPSNARLILDDFYHSFREINKLHKEIDFT